MYHGILFDNLVLFFHLPTIAFNYHSGHTNAFLFLFFHKSFLVVYCQSPRARHPGMWSQVGLRKHHYEKASGSDGILVELFQILKDDAVALGLKFSKKKVWGTKIPLTFPGRKCMSPGRWEPAWTMNTGWESPGRGPSWCPPSAQSSPNSLEFHPPLEAILKSSLPLLDIPRLPHLEFPWFL